MNFWQLFFSVRGRISRKTYWLCLLMTFVACFVVIVVSNEFGDNALVFSVLLTRLALIWSNIAITVKRWHDRNKSGWWYLISFIPIIGLLWTIIELGFFSGTSGPNRFGMDPLGRRNSSTDGSTAKPPPRSDYAEDDVTEFSPGFVDLISMLAKMAKSDGVVSREEIAIVDAFFKQMFSFSTKLRQEAISVFRQAKDTGVAFEHHARRFYSYNSGNYELLSGTLNLLFSVAIGDGEISSEEEILLNLAISIFGVKCHEYSEYKTRQRAHSASYGKVKEKYYASILGLNERITKESVRIAYRDLVTQYHPDKVAHLGKKLKKVAEEEMKKINEAYEYFRQKYAL